MVLRQGQGKNETRRHLDRDGVLVERVLRADDGLGVEVRADHVVRQDRGEALDAPKVGAGETAAKLIEVFGDTPTYRDVPGLCKAATLAEIATQGWSLNPGRYVGVAPGEEVSDEDFKEQLETLNEELESLNTQARELEQTIAANVAGILEA